MAILEASPHYFVIILITRYNRRALKKFFTSTCIGSIYKAFQLKDRRSMTKNRLKNFIAPARCILEGKMLRAALYIACYK